MNRLSVSHPALGVPPPSHSSWFSHQRMKKYSLPYTHICCKVYVSVYQRHPVCESRWLDTKIGTHLVTENIYQQESLTYLFPLMRMSPLNFVPRPPCRLAIILHSVVPSSPKNGKMKYETLQTISRTTY